MPNWEQESASCWLEDIRPMPAEWPPTIRPIETAGDVPRLLEQIGEVLDEICEADRESLAAALRSTSLQQQFRVVLAQLGAARVLRLIHWMAEQDLPDTHLIISGLTAGDTAEARALHATITIATSRISLRRAFAPERIAALHEAADAALSRRETA
jgi:hypothetical protein